MQKPNLPETIAFSIFFVHFLPTISEVYKPVLSPYSVKDSPVFNKCIISMFISWYFKSFASKIGEKRNRKLYERKHHPIHQKYFAVVFPRFKNDKSRAYIFV